MHDSSVAVDMLKLGLARRLDRLEALEGAAGAVGGAADHERQDPDGEAPEPDLA